MASRCVSAISDLNPKIAARGEDGGCYRGVKADIADTHREAMLHIIYSIPNMYMYINVT